MEIVLLAPEWRSRTLIRAQLIEEAYDVAATNTWESLRRFLRPGSKPKLVIVDLEGLEHPENVLRDLGVLMQPDRVLVLSAHGTMVPSDIERLGFRVMKRPVMIGDILTAAGTQLANHAEIDAVRRA